jgi:hypothetical protein
MMKATISKTMTGSCLMNPKYQENWILSVDDQDRDDGMFISAFVIRESEGVEIIYDHFIDKVFLSEYKKN